MPALFTENFDYQDIRKDFLSGILDSELLGKTVYLEIVDSGYAALVSTQQMYNAVRCERLLYFIFLFSYQDSFSHE